MPRPSAEIGSNDAIGELRATVVKSFVTGVLLERSPLLRAGLMVTACTTLRRLLQTSDSARTAQLQTRHSDSAQAQSRHSSDSWMRSLLSIPLMNQEEDACH